MPVFTAPYSKCPDPSRVVENAVSDYVRRHMGVRVEAIQKKPMFVYNTWVPFLTHIDAKLIRELADAAAECGIEEFVIDDGWQINISDGKYGRGDWAVDEKKFPGGLKPVFDYIKSKGMRPGLWLSLAWADPASVPMKEHPEWFVKDKAGNLSNLHTMRGNARTACMATPHTLSSTSRSPRAPTSMTTRVRAATRKTIPDIAGTRILMRRSMKVA